MIRIAAVGDVHLGSEGRFHRRPELDRLGEHADLLLLAGDLSNFGRDDEARVVAREFSGLPVPVVAVLGNHDHHAGRPEEFAEVLRGAGITVLEGRSTAIDTPGGRVGIAGVKGFGGGFLGGEGSAFGEAEMKAFIGHSRESAEALENALHALDADHRVALTHYAPCPDTLEGEPAELFPFLGSQYLAAAIDGGRVDLAVHGHAHHGSEFGATPGGVPVRNVAEPVLGAAYRVYHLGA